MRPTLTSALVCTMVMLWMAIAAAAGTALVSQKGRTFAVARLEIVHGDVVRFMNDDTFLHQIYVNTPAFNYESAEQEPGGSVEIRFPNAGSFEVRCEIHPKMLLHVDVR